MDQNKIININSEEDNLIAKFSNIEAEIALIGCLLWDNRNYEKISDFIDEAYFVNQNHQIIFKKIKDLLNKNILVSPITLKNYLSENDLGVEVTEYLNQIKVNYIKLKGSFCRRSGASDRISVALLTLFFLRLSNANKM